MKKFLTILFFLPLFVNAQTIDTLPNAKAYQPNFFPILIPGLTYLQAGLTTEGHVYMVGLSLTDTVQYGVNLIRIDCFTKQVTYKLLSGIAGTNSMLWRNFFDSLGNMYTGFASGTRHIMKFNFKDSIYIEDLGDGFVLPNLLMYTGSLGRDGHVLFGSSSGGTFWSEYDPYNKILTEHQEIDSQQGYVLTIQGDSDWVYAQVGQNTWIKYWAIRKSDGYKKVIDSVSSSTRFSTDAKRDGCYYQNPVTAQLYRMSGETRIPVASTLSPSIEYHETGNDITWGAVPGGPMVKSYMDNTQNILFYSINGVQDSVPINIPGTPNTIRRSWVDNSTGDNYYFGEYYGNTYKNDTMHTLGYIGFNTYSHVQVNDSIIYFGGYPSGVVAKYNKNQPWTAQKYINGTIKNLSATTNPALVTYFKSGTDAGFHHTEIMVKTDDGYIVAGGTVIRIANTSSVGALNISTGVATGYDYNKIADWTYITDIAIWRNYALVAVYGGAQKIYVYDYAHNVMVDSISFGWTGYGKLYVIGDKLIGVSNNHIYDYNLAEKKLVQSHSYPDNSISYSYMMPDGRILITSTGGIVLPTDMCVNFIPYSVSTGEISVYQDKLFTYTGWNVLRLNNYFKTDANIDSPQGVTNLIKRKLKMIQ